jgi:membrane fusion protein, multidrug efflux system
VSEHRETPGMARYVRGAARPLLLWVVPAVVIAVGLWVYFSQSRYVSTDNAFVQFEKTMVSPYITGHVMEVFVRENDKVEQGQVLLQIEDIDTKIKVKQSLAVLEAARTKVDVLKATYDLQQAEVDVALDQAKFSKNELVRQQEMASKKMAPQSDVDEAEQEYELMRGAAAIVRQQMQETVAKLAGSVDLDIEEHPNVREARANLENAELMLSRTQLKAPRSGVVSQLPFVGDALAAGVPALAIVDDRAPWIEANFKESDLTRMKPGQPVDIEIDTYPDHVLHGHIESIANATGAEFSVLPPQNSSGNWVKVVQRIPVRIAIDDAVDDVTLRSGMSAYVKVDLGTES